jgi:hypothetical protein
MIRVIDRFLLDRVGSGVFVLGQLYGNSANEADGSSRLSKTTFN